MDNERWPAARYRVEEGKSEMRVFDRPEDVPVGWGFLIRDDIGNPVRMEPDPEVEALRGLINFDGLSDDALREIAEKAGIKFDRRWGRKRLEAALRGENGNV